jgi:hypothetical protein
MVGFTIRFDDVLRLASAAFGLEMLRLTSLNLPP